MSFEKTKDYQFSLLEPSAQFALVQTLEAQIDRLSALSARGAGEWERLKKIEECARLLGKPDQPRALHNLYTALESTPSPSVSRHDDGEAVKALVEGWKLAARYIIGCACQIGCSADEATGIVRRTREALSKTMLEPETMEHGLSISALRKSGEDGKGDKNGFE